jgi:hypothetical protein
MSRTSKLLLGVLASMMVWSLVGADELDSTKQEDRAGFGPAARQVVDAQALQSLPCGTFGSISDLNEGLVH